MTQTIPLFFISDGQSATLVKINAGRSLHQRLLEIGMVEGAEVTVHKNKSGSLIVDVEGSRYALGCGMAMKILVKES